MCLKKSCQLRENGVNAFKIDQTSNGNKKHRPQYSQEDNDASDGPASNEPFP